MTLQPTSPLRVAKHINEAIELFKNDDRADSLVSVIEVPHNYMPEKIMDIKGKYLVGNSEAKIVKEFDLIMGSAKREYSLPELWDGKTADRIADIIERQID